MPLAAVAIDTTAIRCPKTSPEQRAVLTRRVAPPKPDTPKGVSNKVLRGKIDELRIALRGAQKVGLAIADERDRCASGDAEPAPAKLKVASSKP